MRRSVCLLAVVLLVVPLLGSDAPKEYDGATETDELQGTWTVVSGTVVGSGRGRPLDGLALTFSGGQYQFQGDWDERGAYTVDRSRQPHHLDIAPTGGKKASWARAASKLIYQLDGDVLRIAFAGNDGARPASFDEVGTVVYTYKRVK